MTSDDWNRLYEAVTTGDLPVIDGIAPKLREFLLRVAYYHLQGRPGITKDAEDCVQEALIAIWKAGQKRQACRERRAMCSWCTRIVIHKVLDYLDKPWHSDGSIDGSPQTDKEWPEEIVSTMDEDSDPLVQVIRKELIGKVFTNPRLTYREAQILLASFMEEEDDIIIARYWKISRTTVRVIRMRALLKLRQDGTLDDYQ